MERRDEAIARVLTKESEEFRLELASHQRYERILQEYARRAHLNAEDELEKKKVQKIKLAGKDRMARMILTYRRQHPELAARAESSELTEPGSSEGTKP